jgi:adenine-specific DNA-methyltransferase
VKQGVVPLTFWAEEEYETPFELGSASWKHAESGHSQQGINELTAIVGRGEQLETVKPLKLFAKIINLWCPPRGLVVDPFAGSGTTAHAILQLNSDTGSSRRFVLMEQGRADRDDRYARTLLVDRLRRVINGRWATGNRTPLGGGFRFLSLTQRVDARAVLAMEREELIDLLLTSHWDDDSKYRPALIRITGKDAKYLIANDDKQLGYFLVWNGGSNSSSTIDERVHNIIIKEASAHGIRPPYYVYARYEDYQTDDIRFCKIPDVVLRHVGLSESRDLYNE